MFPHALYRRLRKLEHDSDRKVRAMQERLNSTVQRYEEEVSYLRQQKARLEEQFDIDQHSNYSMYRGFQ